LALASNSFLNAMQAPIGKPIETLGLTRHRVAVSSRIREVRENLSWILERWALEREALKRYLSIFIERIFDSSVEGGMPSLAAAPKGPETRPLVSVSAAQIISRSSIEDLLETAGAAGSNWRDSRRSQLSLTEKSPFL
jgi:hypothetical protein